MWPRSRWQNSEFSALPDRRQTGGTPRSNLDAEVPIPWSNLSRESRNRRHPVIVHTLCRVVAEVRDAAAWQQLRNFSLRILWRNQQMFFLQTFFPVIVVGQLVAIKSHPIFQFAGNMEDRQRQRMR